jgi:hypothetical protein
MPALKSATIQRPIRLNLRDRHAGRAGRESVDARVPRTLRLGSADGGERLSIALLFVCVAITDAWFVTQSLPYVH